MSSAAACEIGGAWLVWQGYREHRGIAGNMALAHYEFVATFQPDQNFGRMAWGVVADGFRPDRLDIIGAAVCLPGVAVIIDAPR